MFRNFEGVVCFGLKMCCTVFGDDLTTPANDIIVLLEIAKLVDREDKFRRYIGKM